MAEILSVIHREKSLEDLDLALKERKFEPVNREDVDPTIRRLCRRSESLDRLDLVKALSHGDDGSQFGIVTIRKDGVREYCWVDREKFEIHIASHKAVEKRRRRYKKKPWPENAEDQSRFLEFLIFEVIERWCRDDETSPGAPLPLIVNHVADYANIEIKHARKLVDRQLPIMRILEKREVDGEERWRIRPSLLRIYS
jgi:hypothetical protein